MKSIFKALSILALLYLLLTGCDIGTLKKETGTLVLSFPMAQSRTLLPDISMEPAGYDIDGSGPDGAAFSVTSNQSPIEVSNLAFGEWTVTVYARNGDGTIIGQGEAITTVHVGETSVVNIVVIPLEGTGTVDLAVNWNAADTEYPSIVSEIIPVDGEPIGLDFTTTNGNQGTCVNSTIPTGFHTLLVKLMDGNTSRITPILTIGAVEIIRIVKDETTTGTFNFTTINKPGGFIQVNITPELDDPLVVTLSGQQEEMNLGASMTLTASVPGDVGNVTYVWYINGESYATGESYTVTGLPAGYYRLDVLAFATNGSRAGSDTCHFLVLEEPAPPVIELLDIHGKLEANTGIREIRNFAGIEEFSDSVGSSHTNSSGRYIASASHTRTITETPMQLNISGYASEFGPFVALEEHSSYASSGFALQFRLNARSQIDLEGFISINFDGYGWNIGFYSSEISFGSSDTSSSLFEEFVISPMEMPNEFNESFILEPGVYSLAARVESHCNYQVTPGNPNLAVGGGGESEYLINMSVIEQ